ncbi:serine/threonine protein kinase [bacterium]|nr:serine/threonine protein kinase [bacterium]
MIKRWNDFIFIGDYILLKKIASGGMATVHLARKKGAHGFEKLYAVKQIHDHLRENENFFKMFLQEARLSAKLDHPNIIKIFDLVGEDNSFLMVMEHIKGKNLRSVLRKIAKARLSMYPIALKIISEVLKGLSFAHNLADINGKKLNIIHRDISPQNVMLSYEGEVKIMDFGIAKAADSFEETRTGVLKGKVSYMSPEQAMGRKIDIRSDLYSVGIMLYEFLTLKKCFSSKEGNLLNKVQSGDYIPIDKVLPDLDPELVRIIKKALAFSKEDRYQTAMEFQKDIDDHIYKKRFSQNKMNLSLFMHNIFNEEIKTEYGELSKLNKEAAKIPYFGDTKNKKKKKPKTYIEEATATKVKGKKINLLKLFLNIILILFGILFIFDLLFYSYYKDFVESFPFSEKTKSHLVYRPGFIPKIDLIPYEIYKNVEVKLPHKKIKFIFQPKPMDLIVKDSDSETIYKTIKETTGIYSINILSRKKYNLTFDKNGYKSNFEVIDLVSTNTLPMTINLEEKQSKLNLSFVPEDSMLYIDNDFKSNTSPYTFLYNPISNTAVHIIELKHDGYVQYKKTIVFSGDSKTIPIKLAVKNVVVTFKLIPWGKIYEHGKLIGLVDKGGSVKKTVQAGKHTFKFLYPDNDATRTHTYNIQGSRSITINFERIFGRVVVTSYPTGANVSIDETLSGNTPLSIPLKKGYHHIVVYKENYVNYDVHLTVESGREYPIDCVLRPSDEN